jgi:hypothetical protein
MYVSRNPPYQKRRTRTSRSERDGCVQNAIPRISDTGGKEKKHSDQHIRSFLFVLKSSLLLDKLLVETLCPGRVGDSTLFLAERNHGPLQSGFTCIYHCIPDLRGGSGSRWNAAQANSSSVHHSCTVLRVSGFPFASQISERFHHAGHTHHKPRNYDRYSASVLELVNHCSMRPEGFGDNDIVSWSIAFLEARRPLVEELLLCQQGFVCQTGPRIRRTQKASNSFIEEWIAMVICKILWSEW